MGVTLCRRAPCGPLPVTGEQGSNLEEVGATQPPIPEGEPSEDRPHATRQGPLPYTGERCSSLEEVRCGVGRLPCTGVSPEEVPPMSQGQLYKCRGLDEQVLEPIILYI